MKKEGPGLKFEHSQTGALGGGLGVGVGVGLTTLMASRSGWRGDSTHAEYTTTVLKQYLEDRRHGEWTDAGRGDSERARAIDGEQASK